VRSCASYIEGRKDRVCPRCERWPVCGFWFSKSKSETHGLSATSASLQEDLAIRNYVYIQDRCSSTNFVATTGAMPFDRAPESRLDGLAFGFKVAIVRNTDPAPVVSKNLRSRCSVAQAVLRLRRLASRSSKGFWIASGVTLIKVVFVGTQSMSRQR
jgi:hypothetical protein